MRAEYDFSNSKKNPYVKKTKKQITINLDVEVVDYFKEMAKQDGIPYQTLINMYLNFCKEKQMHIAIEWKECQKSCG